MNSQVDETYYDGLHEECGVFGVYDLDGGDVASTIYYGLFALQHRGQESCGIAVSDTKGTKGKVLSSRAFDSRRNSGENKRWNLRRFPSGNGTI